LTKLFNWQNLAKSRWQMQGIKPQQGEEFSNDQVEKSSKIKVLESRQQEE
jgi:hypothetical protein